MNRFSRWASSSQALYVLAAVFAGGAVIDIVLGHRISALVSAVLAIVIVGRVPARRSR
jgi:hypothetical protein